MADFELSPDKVITRMVTEVIQPFAKNHLESFTSWWAGLDQARRERFITTVQPTMIHSITELYHQREEKVRLYLNKSQLVPAYLVPENSVVYTAQHLPKMIEKMAEPEWAKIWLREKVLWLRSLIQVSVPFRELLQKSQFWKPITEHDDGEFASFITTTSERSGSDGSEGLVSFMKITKKTREDLEQKRFFDAQISSAAFAWKGEIDFILNACFSFVQAVCSLTDEWGMAISRHLESPVLTSILHLEDLRPQANSCTACGKKPERLSNVKACGKCFCVTYCSRDCQVADWKKHKKACFVNTTDSAVVAGKKKNGGSKAEDETVAADTKKEDKGDKEEPKGLSFSPKLAAFFFDLSTGMEPPMVVRALSPHISSCITKVSPPCINHPPSMNTHILLILLPRTHPMCACYTLGAPTLALSRFPSSATTPLTSSRR